MSMVDSRLLARPLYVQARDVIASQILTGAWKPGSPLPNESQLAHQLGLSIGTIRKALDILEQEQVVTRRQGRGTFINDFAEQRRPLTRFGDLNGNEIKSEKRGKSLATISADETTAKRLGIARGEDVIRIERVRCVAGHPFSAETAYLPAKRFPTRLDNMITYRLSLLAQKNGRIISHAEEAIAVAVASPTDVHDLGIAKGTPILVLDRSVYSDRQEVLEWRIAHCSLPKMRMIVQYK